MSVSTLGELGAVFATSLEEVVSTVTGVLLAAMPSPANTGFDELVGFMSLHGKKNGVLFISAQEDGVRTLCARMLGLPKDVIAPGDVQDMMGEIVNMTAGNAKLRLAESEYMFQLSTPFVMTGKEMSVVAKKLTQAAMSILSDEEISLKLKVVY